VRNRKRNIWFVLLIILLLVICRFLFFSFSLNSLKAKIEDEIAWATGMETTIEGDIRARLLPTFSLTANKPALVDEDFLDIRAQKLEMEIPLLSMFSSQVEIRAIKIKQPDVVLLFESRDTSIPEIEVVEPAEPTGQDESMQWKVNLVDVIILDGSFRFYNHNNMDTIECYGVSVASDSILLSGNADTLRFADVFAFGKLNIDSCRFNMLRIDNIKLNVIVGDGILDVGHEEISARGEPQQGHFYMDLSSEVPAFHIVQDINGFLIEELMEKIDSDPLIGGLMDFSVDMRFSGNTSSERWLSTIGEMQLNGKDMILYGTDLDRLAKQFERSQKFNFVDMSALFLAGPIGIAVTKGGDYANLIISNKGDSTIVHEFVSRWSMSAGELRAEDVAFSTDENRIAVNGSLNLWYENFNDIEFALVNDFGCAVFQQGISGSFANPQTSDVKVVGTLLGPLKNIFRGKKCKDPFYKGSVKPSQFSEEEISEE